MTENSYRYAFATMLLLGLAAIAFSAGLLFSMNGFAADGKKRVIYKDTNLDFDGLNIEGEMKNPAEFYFQQRTVEKFDSLVKRRKNFHRELLRDAVMAK